MLTPIPLTSSHEITPEPCHACPLPTASVLSQHDSATPEAQLLALHDHYARDPSSMAVSSGSSEGFPQRPLGLALSTVASLPTCVALMILLSLQTCTSSPPMVAVLNAWTSSWHPPSLLTTLLNATLLLSLGLLLSVRRTASFMRIGCLLYPLRNADAPTTRLIPFAVDEFGRLGPHALSLLWEWAAYEVRARRLIRGGRRTSLHLRRGGGLRDSCPLRLPC